MYCDLVRGLLFAHTHDLNAVMGYEGDSCSVEATRLCEYCRQESCTTPAQVSCTSSISAIIYRKYRSKGCAIKKPRGWVKVVAGFRRELYSDTPALLIILAIVVDKNPRSDIEA